MKRRICLGILLFTCIVAVCIAGIYSIPRLRVSLFVNIYHQWIEEELQSGHGVPGADAVFLGYKAVNTWDEPEKMTEFIIMSWGETYYGCYYSPADLPLAFHNADVALTDMGDQRWQWRAEGDNHGEVSKITNGWYFFSASF